jgi:hypothetical protein
MAWGKAGYFDGARTEGHSVGVTGREVLAAAQLAAFALALRAEHPRQRAAQLADLGISEVHAPTGTFFRLVIAKRSKRPKDLCVFFIVRAEPRPWIQFIGFRSMAEYAKDEDEYNARYGVRASDARQT